MRSGRTIASFVLLICQIFFLSGSFAEHIPTRDRFSVGWDKIYQIEKRGVPIRFDLSIDPEAISGFQNNAQDGVLAMIRALSLSGVMTVNNGLTELDFTAFSNTDQIASISRRNNGVDSAVSLNDMIVSGSDDQLESFAVSAGFIGALGDLFAWQSGSPLKTLITDQVRVIWGLASPYERDVNVSVASGQTSHGVTYQLDNDAFHNVMQGWIGQLPDGYPEELLIKLKQFAQQAVVPKNLRFTLAYGEGDVLRSATGSGSIKYNGKTASLHFRYTCTLSSTRISKSWSLSYEPDKGDTLNLRLSTLTSSNGKSRGANETELVVRGKWNDHAYRIKVTMNYLNRFTTDTNGVLTELLTGEAKASLRYGGIDLFSLTAKRNGVAESGSDSVTVNETWRGEIENSDGLHFSGALTISLQTDSEAGLVETNEPIDLNACDSSTLTDVAEKWQIQENEVFWSWIDALDDQTLLLLENAY